MDDGKELRKAEEIMKKEAGDEQTSLIMHAIEKEFTDEDHASLRKLNTFYENGFITTQEYVTRITVLLHQRKIQRHTVI